MKQPREKLSDEPVLERIMELLRAQGKTDKELTDYLGLTNGVFSKWKYKNGRSYFKHINEIAEFLGVTPAFLMHGDDSEEVTIDKLNVQESKLLKLYRKLGDGGRDTLLDVVDRFVVAEEVNKLKAR